MNEPRGIEALLKNQERRSVEMPTNLDSEGHPVCPHCGCNRSAVENSYPWQNGIKRRRRICDHCKLSFHTLQSAEQCESE